jgi:hypothetical protein
MAIPGTWLRIAGYFFLGGSELTLSMRARHQRDLN